MQPRLDFVTPLTLRFVEDVKLRLEVPQIGLITERQHPRIVSLRSLPLRDLGVVHVGSAEELLLANRVDVAVVVLGERHCKASTLVTTE